MAELFSLIDPTVEHWIRLSQHNHQVAITELVRLILNYLKTACTNRARNDFELHELIDMETMEVHRFVKQQLNNKKFDLKTLSKYGEDLGTLLEEIIDRTNDFSWMMMFVAELVRELAENTQSVFLVERSIILSFIKLLSKMSNDQHQPLLKRISKHLTETITNHVSAYSAIHEMGMIFADQMIDQPIATVNDEISCLYATFMKYNDEELIVSISNSANSLMDATVRSIDIFTKKEFVDAVSDILLKEYPVAVLKYVFALAIQIQKKRPGTDLFKVEVFHDFLLEVSADLQKLSAELFHSRYQNPNQPTAFLIEVTNLCRANTFDLDKSMERMLNTFWSYNEFQNWEKVFSITLDMSADRDFLNYFWFSIVNAVLLWIAREDDATEQKKTFMHAAIEFLGNLNEEQHMNIYGLVISFMVQFDADLEFVDNNHGATLAGTITRFSSVECCETYEHEEAVVKYVKVLMGQQSMEPDLLYRWIDELMKRKIFDQAEELLQNPKANIDAVPGLRDGFMKLAAFAKHSLLGEFAMRVCDGAYRLLQFNINLNRNRDLWSYVIKIFAESCIEIVRTQKLLLDGIDVYKITQLLVVLMTKLDGKLNPIFNAIFTALCLLVCYKIGACNPQLLVDVLIEKLETPIEQRNSPAFQSFFFKSMFGSFACLLLVTNEAVDVQGLVVKTFKMFPNEDYVYRLLRALIVRQSSKMFLDSVLAIFLTYPVRKLRMDFIENLDAVIEAIPLEKRLRLRFDFNKCVKDNFGAVKIRNLDAKTKKKAKELADTIDAEMIKPYLKVVVSANRSRLSI